MGGKIKGISAFRFRSFMVYMLFLFVFLASSLLIIMLSAFSGSERAPKKNTAHHKQFGGSHAVAYVEDGPKHFNATPIVVDQLVDNQEVKSKIEALVSEHGIIVFAKSRCPFCIQTIQLLDSKIPSVMRHQYAVVYLDEIPYESVIKMYMNALDEKTGARTVPRVFVGGKCIGGNDDTQKMNQKNELDDLLTNSI